MTNEDHKPAIPKEVQLAIELEKIFMPHARRQQDIHFGKQRRFVHYTSAEAALNMIKSKRLWMRSTTCMADYREVQHGFDILNKFFSDSSKRNVFIEALDPYVPNAAVEAINLFNQWWYDTQINTYIASISEHDDDEDSYGRLSMWRAFGGNTARVALVLRVPFYSGGAEKLSIMFSPVAYLKEEGVHNEIAGITQNIHANGDFLRSVERERVVGTVFNMLVAGVVCLKHVGFHEEREWRVIYFPNRSRSPLVEIATEIIGGVPQTIHKLPLDKSVSEDLAGLDLASMFDRLIIGPSPYPWVMYEAFVAALMTSGVQEAGQRVCISDIPIRT